MDTMALVTALERQPIVKIGNMSESRPLLGYSTVGQAIPCAVQARCTSVTDEPDSALQPRRDRPLNWFQRNKISSQRAAGDTSDSFQIKRIYNKRDWALLSRKRGQHTRTDSLRASHFQSSHSGNVRFNLNPNQYRTEDLRVIETHTHVIPYHKSDIETDKNNCKQIKVSSHKSSDLAYDTVHMHAYLAEESFRSYQSGEFHGILSMPKNTKSHCNLKYVEKLGSFLCVIGVLMIFLGSCFDRMARQLATASFDLNIDMLAATLRSPNWLEELLASSSWLVGAEATISFQPYTMKHEGKSVIFLESGMSTSISVKDEGNNGIRLFRDKTNLGKFDIPYDNINAAHIIVLKLVEGVAYDTFGNSFLKDAMVSQIMSRINITDQVIVHKSIQNIIEDFDFPDYNTLFIPEYGYYSPTDEVKQSMRNVIKFLFESESDESLLYHNGECTIQYYKHVNPEPIKDFDTLIAASSEYTLPGIKLDMNYDEHTSWMGILTSEYSSFNVDIPKYMLDKIPLNLKNFPLKVTHPHLNEFYDASSESWMHNKVNSSNSSEASITYKHPVVSLQLHNTLGVPITAKVHVDLQVQVPDQDEFGILKGQTIPYMKMSINVSRLPDWLMEALRIFCAFRLFFVVFILLASPVCLVTGIVFLCNKGSQTKVTQVECEDKCPLLTKKPKRNYGSLSRTSQNC
ncbi:unnamed protein product [Meganyctiphanes norvegica]|uniref:Uncharacterized protein n=1 Tax=Meganyctiphanes norvegica TaxID=48144 RepID=A0AAV2R9H1_MEGNR